MAGAGACRARGHARSRRALLPRRPHAARVLRGGRSARVVACLAPRSTRADRARAVPRGRRALVRGALRSRRPVLRGRAAAPVGRHDARLVRDRGAGGRRDRAQPRNTGAGRGRRRRLRGPAGRDRARRARRVGSAAGCARTPPGFEGSRLRVADATEPPPAASPERRRALPTRPCDTCATRRGDAAAGRLRSRREARAPPAKGGHGVRNRRSWPARRGRGGRRGRGPPGPSGERRTPATTMGTRPAADGVAGRLRRHRDHHYSGSCTGTDDVVLNLQQAGPRCRAC